MKRKNKIKKLVSILSIICIASTFIISVSAYDATSNDIVGEWTFNEHIQPPDPTNENIQTIGNLTFEYTYNNTIKHAQSIMFIVTNDTDATKLYRMGIVSNDGIDYVYEAWFADGGWLGGSFDSNFSTQINVTSAYGGQNDLNKAYTWLNGNASKAVQNTNTTYFTLNNVSTLITYEINSTWEDWIGSNYDQTGIYTDNTYIYNDNQRMYDNSGNWVKVTDKISSYTSPGLAYFFRSYEKTFTVDNGYTIKTFHYLSTITNWSQYVTTNGEFYIQNNAVYYLDKPLALNGNEVSANDTIEETRYSIRYNNDWYLGYQEGYEQGASLSGALLDIGSIIDATIGGAKSIFVNSFGFELFGINIASTLISILVIAIVIWVVKKMR